MAAEISRRTWLLAVPALCLTERIAVAEPAPVRLVLVIAKTSPLRNLAFAQLRDIYKGKQRTFSGQTVVPLNHPAGTQDRTGFDRLVLGLGPEEVARYWIDQKIRGSSAAPRTIESIGALLRSVARQPGTIGYVRSGFGSPDLVELSIDDRASTDVDYPIVYVPRSA